MNDETPTAFELLRTGGEWLGAARNWLKWHTRNGDQVTWSSDDLIEPQFSVRQVEELAATVAAAAMRPQPSEKRISNALKARWKAEAEAAAMREVVAAARAVVKGRIPAYSSTDWKHSRISDSLTDRLQAALGKLGDSE